MLLELIQWRLYLIFAFFCGCSFIIVYFGYPETAGVPLEEIGALFGDEITVPQDDDDDDETQQRESSDHEQENFSPRPLRRSISSHPRFQSEEERAARAVAARVAAEEQRAAQSYFGLGGGPLSFLGRLFGRKSATPDRRLYEEVRRDEH